MSADQLPLILEPETLDAHLDDKDIVVIDLSKPETYAQYHIPGAIHLNYSLIVRANKPVMGLLPTAEDFSVLLSEHGISPDKHVVSYDDEGGGRAARLLWTLEAAGHKNFSLLNGGLHAWANDGHPFDQQPVTCTPASYTVEFNDGPVASRDYILARLNDDNVRLIDARSPHEYTGEKSFAARPGHIPGAINLGWHWSMDHNRNLRLKDAGELLATLESQGITPDHEVIVYCQTHHRSAHTYIMLKSLGFTRVKGYEGSWSDWGNQPDTPVEV